MADPTTDPRASDAPSAQGPVTQTNIPEGVVTSGGGEEPQLTRTGGALHQLYLELHQMFHARDPVYNSQDLPGQLSTPDQIATEDQTGLMNAVNAGVAAGSKAKPGY